MSIVHWLLDGKRYWQPDLTRSKIQNAVLEFWTMVLGI